MKISKNSKQLLLLKEGTVFKHVDKWGPTGKYPTQLMMVHKLCETTVISLCLRTHKWKHFSLNCNVFVVEDVPDKYIVGAIPFLIG